MKLRHSIRVSRGKYLNRTKKMNNFPGRFMKFQWCRSTFWKNIPNPKSQ